MPVASNAPVAPVATPANTAAQSPVPMASEPVVPVAAPEISTVPVSEAAPVSTVVEVPAAAPVVEGAPAVAPVAPAERPQQNFQNRQGQGRPSGRWRESTYESSSVSPGHAPAHVKKVVLLNATEPGEIRVAILENGELAEIFMERKSHGQQAGNIYKGRVVNVEPSLQAAFVDLGGERNGFLHASDCIPPDGGYGDILTKMPRGGGNRNQGQGRPQNQPNNQQQARPYSPPPAAVAVAPEPAQPITIDATDLAQAAKDATAGLIPPSAAPANPAAPNGQQQNGNPQQNGKRRRRRRGGRGRSGRGRPGGPAPMLAPASGDGAEHQPIVAGIAAVSTATATNTYSETPSAPQTTEAALPAQNAGDAGAQASSETPAESAAVQASAEGLTARESNIPEEEIAPITGGVAESESSDDEAGDDESESNDHNAGSDDNEEDGDEGDESEAEVSVSERVENQIEQKSAESAVTAAAPENAAEPYAPQTPSIESQPSESSDNGSAQQSESSEGPYETGIPDGEVPERSEADAVNDAVDQAQSDIAAAENAEAAAAENAPETQVAGSEAQSETAVIPAPGQPAPAMVPQQQRRSGRSGRERPDRRYTIQEMLREGQEVLIQVAKEGIGQKGPALTTYISMPGRYLVLMPAVSRLGVSKRIESEEQRRALKDALAQINPPDDMGVIVRTAGTGRSKDELQRDMNYLMHAWENLKKKARMVKAPALIYQEGDVVTRVFRDVISDDVSEIIIDDPVVLERAREFIRETAPGNEHKLKLYSEADPLFHRYGVEQQMQRLFNRKVNLRNGGSIVIEQTEALVAIDVNTGRFREKRNQDDTILQTNLEAAREIARQLRLRDIGGLVMIDFIDMEIHEHRRKVERELKAHLARDKARINVLPVSTLGVVEMTRQRIRHSLRKTLFERCPHCSGSGHIKSAESLGLELLREIKSQLKDVSVRRVKVLLNSAVAFAILNHFRKDLVRMEEAHGVTIEVCGDPVVSLSQMQVSTAKEGGEWVLKKVSEVDDYVRNP
jgi:ribonuclease E